MKHSLFVLGVALLFTGCAGVRVQETQIATGAHSPTAIYIRPFSVTDTVFKGNHRGPGEAPIRRSLAPADWGKALKGEMEKLAPAMEIAESQMPTEGWLVEGSLDVVDAGHPVARGVFGPLKPLSIGRSHVKIHVRITDMGAAPILDNGKDASKGAPRSNVIYEFDLNGGSRSSGALGSITAPGVGYAVPFDFKNAAERVLIALSVDPFNYGGRTSPFIR